MKYYIIAGEQSADLYGAMLIQAIKIQDKKAIFKFWGGDNMIAETGQKPVFHIKQTAIMGFTEVIKNIKKIKSFFSTTKNTILQFNPHVIIFIDYPGFNLRMAKWAYKNQIKTVFYIAPQAWAWKANRIHQLKKYVDRLLVILPFEKKWFAKHNVHTHYIGHPLVEYLSSFEYKNIKSQFAINKKKSIALFPGSRKQEVAKMLPIMLTSCAKYNNFDTLVAGVKSIDEKFYHSLMKNSNAILIANNNYNILNICSLAIVSSGTATLETALHGVPQIVCYKTSKLNYEIGKRVIKLPYISLVNIILEKYSVIELIQNDCTIQKIRSEMDKYITTGDYVYKDYEKLKSKFRNSENASKNAATVIIDLIQPKI